MSKNVRKLIIGQHSSCYIMEVSITWWEILPFLLDFPSWSMHLHFVGQNFHGCIVCLNLLLYKTKEFSRIFICNDDWHISDPNFFPHISSSYVMMRRHIENQLPRWPGSASKFCVGGWWWVVNSEFSDRFGYSLTWPSWTIWRTNLGSGCCFWYAALLRPN